MNSFARSRLASILVIIVIWTVTYLTNLGASEFRSEEGHRVDAVGAKARERQLRRAMRGDRAILAETASGELNRSRLTNYQRKVMKSPRLAHARPVE